MTIVSWEKAAKFLLLVILLVFFAVKGVFPAYAHIDTDFPNYYTAGRIVLSGTNITRLYDDGWFHERMQQDGVDVPGKFSPNPPSVALLSAPLALFPPLTALRILTTLNLMALSGSVIVLQTLLRPGYFRTLGFVLLSGMGLANDFRFGQVYVLISFTIILGYYLYTKGYPIAAGILFGFWIPIKYFPLAFLPFFFLHRELRLCAAAILTAGALSLLTVEIMGWDIHRIFLTQVIGSHLVGNLSMQSPFSAAFQSFDALYRTIFLFDPTLNPSPPIPFAAGFFIAEILTVAIIAGSALTVVYRLRSIDQRGRYSIGILAITALLLAPATGTYHYVLLWLPLGLILGEREQGVGNSSTLALLCCYGIIGFAPIAFLRSFSATGLLIPLAYPRLLALIVLFALVIVRACVVVARHQSHSRTSASAFVIPTIRGWRA